MKKHRALSAVIGSVFLVAVVVSSITYVTFSMNMLGDFSKSVITEEKRQRDKQDEKFELSSVAITGANKLDGVVTNSGQIPLQIKSLWIEEVGASNSIKKFNVNATIAPGNTLKLISKVDYTMSPTKGYNLKIISGRGETQTFQINSVGSKSLYLDVHAIPDTIPTGFQTTVYLTVTNNSTSNAPVLNLTPVLTVDATNCSPLCTVTEVGTGPSPPSYPSLKQGETAIFSWVYEITGSNTHTITFNASLLNGVGANTDATTVEVREIASALSSGTALTSLGLDDPVGANDILYLQQETFDTPTTPPPAAYQMAGSTPDLSGKYIDLSTEVPNFFSNNSTDTIVIPAGTWSGSLRLLHEWLPDSLIGSGDDEVDMIFHLNDGTDTEADSTAHTTGLNRGDGANSPTWVSTGVGGIDNSPYYTFDGNDWFNSFSAIGGYNDIEASKDSTSLWFKANNLGTTRAMLIRFDAGSTCYNCVDYYQISIGDGTAPNAGKVVFQFETNDGGGTVPKCVSAARWDNNSWHHIVAVRESNKACKLYVDGGNMVSGSSGGSGNNVSLSASGGYFHIGSNQASEYFTGSIDQIMHWNDRALTAGEVTTLYNTKYGATASVLDFLVYETNINGVNIQPPIISQLNVAIPFKDTKALSTTTDYNSIDSIFKTLNFTASLNDITIDPQNRLNFTINYKSGLDTVIRIDDNTMVNPQRSLIQFPAPTFPFPSYFKYDNDNILRVIAQNSGERGTWFVYQGTRAVFKNLSTGDSYAGIVCSVNSTLTNDECNTGGGNDSWKMDEDRDSIYIDRDEVAFLYFFQIQNRPDRNLAQGTLISPGNYHMYVFISGYDENGLSFLRQIDIGKITVSD